MKESQPKRTRPRQYYEHGFEDTGAPGTYYCGVCEAFMDANHFPGDPLDPMDVGQHSRPELSRRTQYVRDIWATFQEIRASPGEHV